MIKKVLISTGGSGGHVIPAITIYNHLKNTHETFISSNSKKFVFPLVNDFVSTAIGVMTRKISRTSIENN